MLKGLTMEYVKMNPGMLGMCVLFLSSFETCDLKIELKDLLREWYILVKIKRKWWNLCGLRIDQEESLLRSDGYLRVVKKRKVVDETET